ncbi:MAG: murI [Crocinitomicaceae bacterium]|jgi:glutamate racemase|nr:murI [Crocinitomicaceae bacterium]
MDQSSKPIGVFDSGYGGLTILSSLRTKLPAYDFLYLGDNARAPYGPRSFDVVFEFTLQAVEYLFAQGCELVILACNTASAKALRTIQQQVLPQKYPGKRVLGVIRPTSEIIGNFSESKHIGVIATEGTIKSESYCIEIGKFFPEVSVNQYACPIWVPLIENALHETDGGKWFIRRDLDLLLEQDPEIDTILLGCTHYPLVSELISEHVPSHIRVISQGDIIANSLEDYLSRHPEIETNCSKQGRTEFLTTENADDFNRKASQFFKGSVESRHIRLV